VNIRQEKGETFRAFMDRFGKFPLNIRDLSPEVALHHLVTVFRLGPFSDNLCKKLTSNTNELRRKVVKFM